VKQQVTEN